MTKTVSSTEKESSPVRKFSIDARTILALGRESLRDHITALLELIKNAYDADATLVEIEIKSQAKNPLETFIRIADNGCGMSEKQVEANWLRIGFSEKRTHTKSGEKGRRKTGEKGIGRLSADRLGSILELRTRTKAEDAFGLKVDWERFDTQGKELGEIPINILPDPEPRIPTVATQPGSIKSPNATSKSSPLRTGTELIARSLRQSWTDDDIRNLYEEISILTPPFRSTSDFSVELITDVLPEMNGRVRSSFLDAAPLQLNAHLRQDGKVEYTILERIDSAALEGSLKEVNETIDWEQIIQHSSSKASARELFGRKLNPLSATLMFFPRKAETVVGTKLSLNDLREFLDKNAGIRVYRDNIRVKPYGNPRESEGDWLGLGDRKARDPAGAARSTFKIAPNQIVGAVFLGRDTNPELVDSSSREGLIQGIGFVQLKRFLLGCISLLETSYHQSFKVNQATNATTPTTNPSAEVQVLNTKLKSLSTQLRETKSKIPRTTDRKVEKSIEQIEHVVAALATASDSLDRLASQATTFRGLASIGIAATVFGHETQSSISQFALSAEMARLFLSQTPPQPTEALEELTKAQVQASKVASWGSFALSRVKRDKRKRQKTKIHKVVSSLVEDMRAAIEASDIEVTCTLAEVEGRTFAMDIESVLINLLSNAYHACQQVQRKRRIDVQLRSESKSDKPGFEIAVSDSGSGVAKQYRDRIWEPLFSTKTNEEGKQTGTGLGLAIVQSVVDEQGGSRDVDDHPKLKGARFTIWLPLEQK
jgi:hypothetical protein